MNTALCLTPHLQQMLYLVTTWWVYILLGEPKYFAKPKSPTFRTPSLLISKLFGFISWKSKQKHIKSRFYILWSFTDFSLFKLPAVEVKRDAALHKRHTVVIFRVECLVYLPCVESSCYVDTLILPTSVVCSSWYEDVLE